MATRLRPALTPDVSTPTTALKTAPPASSNFDERWEAWQATGAAHDRGVRRNLAIVTPFIRLCGSYLLRAGHSSNPNRHVGHERMVPDGTASN